MASTMGARIGGGSGSTHCNTTNDLSNGSDHKQGFFSAFPVGWFSVPTVWGESAIAGSAHTTQSATECMRGGCSNMGWHDWPV